MKIKFLMSRIHVVVGRKQNSTSQQSSAIPEIILPVGVKASLIPKVAAQVLVAAILTFSTLSRAVTIVSGPTFTPATNAPLAGNLQLTTDVNSRVSVTISDGTDIWEKDFYVFARSNSVPLFGFKPGRTNLIQVTAYDESHNADTARQLLTFVTAPLPADFPKSEVLTSNPGQMEPGYNLFIIHNRTSGNGYLTIMDPLGEVVWYRPILQSSDVDVIQLGDGNLFIHEQPPANRFLEMDLLGNTVRTWTPPAAYPINSHEGFITSHGTILYLSDVSEVVSNFPDYMLPINPTSGPNPALETVSVDDNPVVEISATNGALLHVWSSLNLLDPTRVTYLTGDFPSPITSTLDTEHANAVIEDTNDNSIIVSQRDENTVYKFSRATGQLIWILAPPVGWSANLQRYLLTPVGTPFEWSYGQHAPKVTPQGTLVLFDDGEYRASPFDPKLPDPENYSRAVEYRINATNMTISQVWDSYDSGQGGGDRLYSTIMGNVEWLPQHSTVLTTFAWINYLDGKLINTNGALMSRIVEYSHDPVPQVLFDLSFWDYTNATRSYLGYYCYRSYRISDLYAHPAEPIADLTVVENAGLPLLQFSGDPAYSYMIQASSDLVNWTNIDTAYEGEARGLFEFEDFGENQYTTRFYRVLTQ